MKTKTQKKKNAQEKINWYESLCTLCSFSFRYDAHNQIIGSKAKTTITVFFKKLPKEPPTAPQIEKPSNQKLYSHPIHHSYHPLQIQLQDVLETAHRNKSSLKLLLFQCQVSSFVQTFCPQLNSDDVLCNEIFVERFQLSASKIFKYQSLLKLFSKMSLGKESLT